MNTDISTFRNEVSSHVQKAQKFSIEESGERTSKFKPQEQTVKKKEKKKKKKRDKGLATPTNGKEIIYIQFFIPYISISIKRNKFCMHL